MRDGRGHAPGSGPPWRETAPCADDATRSVISEVFSRRAVDALTHLLVGRLLASLFPDAAPFGWIVTLFAVLPDVDTIVWFAPRLRRHLQHRGITHTLPVGLGASVAAGFVAQLAGWAPFWAAAGAAFLGFLSHVSLDVLNWGAPVLWPWRRERLEWTIHGGFRWSAIVSALGMLALAAAGAGAPALQAPLAAGMGAAFGLYLASRAALKLLAVRRHPGRRVLPTGNPFVWQVVEAPLAAPLVAASR